MHPSAAKFSFLVTLPVLLSLGCPSPDGDRMVRVPDGLPEGNILKAACDEVVQKVVLDIESLVQREFNNKRIALVLGDLNNKTGDLPTGDLDYMRHRIKNRLMDSSVFRNNVRVFEDRERWQRLVDREADQPEDLLQEGENQPTLRYHPDYAVFLNGNAHAVYRQNARTYLFTFEFTRMSNGENLLTKDYEVTYDTKGRQQ